MSCPSDCTENGECVSMSYYASTKDPGSGVVYSYGSNWDAKMIYGCNCDVGFSGPACALRQCPTGDDPLTGVGVSTATNPTQFNEIQRVTCKAGGGSFTLTFRGKTTTRIPYNANAAQLQSAIEALTTIGGGNTKIVMSGSQACLDAGTSWTVEFLQNFGALPLMVPDGALLSFADAINIPMLTVVHQVIGTKEDAFCSNRGICDTSTGYCGCSTNFLSSNGYNGAGTRGDCGYTGGQSIQSCPGLTSCSSHGQCAGNPTFTCSCSNGWTAADCSERTCPMDVAWFTYPSDTNVAHISENVECSNMGTCDRSTGLCTCVSGFTGASCNRMSCPGSPVECNGHGQCLNMQQLATLATINGDNAFFTYGNTPNNPLTWDAAKVYGCYCDSGFQGYDCSLQTCPAGDDPLTVDQYDETQLIQCRDSDGMGSLVLTFRQVSSIPLGALTSTSSLQSALQAVSSVGQVIVERLNAADADTLCSSRGSNILVTFLTTHGDVPLIQVASQSIDSITVSEYRKGTKEVAVCSNRGICNTVLGVCECFTGFSSSNGMGGVGTVGDCSYVNPLTLTLS